MGGNASRKNGKLGGRPEKEFLLEGLFNLTTGEPAEHNPSPYYANMKSACHALKLDMAILKDARSRDCPAFGNGAMIHKERLMTWLRKEANKAPLGDPMGDDESNFTEPEEDYTVIDEAGGVGQALKSLQAYERRCKHALDVAEKSTLPPTLKAELVKTKQDAWIKVVNALLKYDLGVATSKRESGELIPLSDAQRGVQALLAWHTIATGDALRNVVPKCEGQDKFEIASLLDGALRASIYRSFKMGQDLGKLPEWLYVTASEYVKTEAPLTLTPASTNVNDY